MCVSVRACVRVCAYACVIGYIGCKLISISKGEPAAIRIIDPFPIISKNQSESLIYQPKEVRLFTG